MGLIRCRASLLSDRNLERVRASRPGGSWRDWEEALRASCHRVRTGKGYGAVYGRMRADAPAPTITTQFFGFGSGRFGHPTQDRGLSLREGAILQSFPPKYAFLEPGKRIEFKKLGRMVGNAVPVLLGQAIARSIRLHLQRHPR
jgi:DNA (cytosine-5)-methyltransferase 1